MTTVSRADERLAAVLVLATAVGAGFVADPANLWLSAWSQLGLVGVADRLGEDAAVLAEYRRALQLDAQAPPQHRLADGERQSVERRIGELSGSE